MKQKRRVFMLYVASTGASLCAPSVFAEFPALKETEAAAQEHGYRVNAKQVDTQKYPQYKEGQSCANCQLYEEVSKTPAIAPYSQNAPSA